MKTVVVGVVSVVLLLLPLTYASSSSKLAIQVRTDSWTDWEINYCCPLFPPSDAPPGSIPPFNGSHSFQLDNTTCTLPGSQTVGWGGYVRAVGPIPSTPHITVNLLKDGKVEASNSTDDKRLTDYTLIDLSTHGKC